MGDLKSFDDEEDVVMTLPWQYMEFVTVFNGINFCNPDDEEGYHFLPKVGRYLYRDEYSYVTDIHKTEPGIRKFEESS